MRAVLTTAAWLLTAVVALAAVTGYGAARAAAGMLEPMWPDPGVPAAWTGDLGAGPVLAALAPGPGEPGPGPGGPAVHLVSYGDLVQHVERRTGWSRARSGDLAALLVLEGMRSGVDPWLLVAVIEVESGFRADAVGSSGEIGLMQILPSTARHVAASLGMNGYSDASLSDPTVNVRLGAAHLGNLLTRFHGDEVAALTTYNAGRSNSLDGIRYAYRVLALAQRASSDVRVAWAPAPGR